MSDEDQRPKKPYYVRGDFPETGLEQDIELIPYLFDLLGKSVSWPAEMSSVDFGALRRDFRLVILTQNHRRVVLESPSDDSVLSRWRSILLLTARLFETQFVIRPEDLSRTLFQTLMEASDHQKEEYFHSQHVALSIQHELGDEDTIRAAGQLYQRMYEGSFRTLISYLRYLLDPDDASESAKLTLDKILKGQVKENLNWLSRCKSLSKDEFELIDQGVLVLVRDAFAHGGSVMRDGMAHLKNGRKSIVIDLDEMQSLVSSLMVTCCGIRSGLWFSFQRHKAQMAMYVKQKYHVEKIHSVLYEAAKEVKFILDECTLIEDRVISLVLSEMSPSVQRIVPSTTNYGSVVLKIHTKLAGPRGERIRDLLKSYSSLFYDYDKLIIRVRNAKGDDKGWIDIQIGALLEGALDENEVYKTIHDD